MSHESKYQYRLKRSGSDVVVEEERTDTTNGETEIELSVWGINRDYRFHLSREGPQRPWVVRELRRPRPSENFDDIERLVRMLAASIDQSAIMAYDEPLPTLFSSRYFSVESAEEVEAHGKALARVKFRFEAPRDVQRSRDSSAFVRLVEGGTLFLDPSEEWRIVEADLSLRNKAKMRLSYRYDPALPRLRTGQSIQCTEPTRDWSETSKLTKATYECAFSPGDFRLTGYGLPEPPGIESSRGFGLAWVLGLAGVAVIVVGVWLMRLRRLQSS